MNIATDIEEEIIEAEPKAKWTPKVIQGGKGGGGNSDGTDWLSELEVNSTVLGQGKKDTNFALGQFTIVYKGSKGILLLVSGTKEPIWVDPIRFCRDYRLYEILQTAEEFDLETKARLNITKELELEKDKNE